MVMWYVILGDEVNIMAIELTGRVNAAGKLELELPEALPPGSRVRLIIEPPDPDQTWFWTPTWQAKELQVDQEVAAGQYKDFATMEEFLEDLDSDDEN